MFNRLNMEVKFVCMEEKAQILFCLIRKEQGQLSVVTWVEKFLKITVNQKVKAALCTLEILF